MKHLRNFKKFTKFNEEHLDMGQVDVPSPKVEEESENVFSDETDIETSEPTCDDIDSEEGQ